MSYSHPIMRALKVRDWLLDNKAPAQARLIDSRDKYWTGIELGSLWTSNLGEVPAVLLTRDEGLPITVGAYLHWLATHQVSWEHRLGGQFYGVGEWHGFRDLGESSWYQRGDPPEAESWPERSAILLQLRWG